MFCEAFANIGKLPPKCVTKFHRSATKGYLYLNLICENVFYGLDVSSGKIRCYSVPTASILDVFPVAGIDCCLSNDGTLYVIDNVQQDTEITQRSPPIGVSKQSFLQWNTTHLSSDHRIFNEKFCRAMAPLKNGIAVLCENVSTWVLKVYAVHVNFPVRAIFSDPVLSIDIPFKKTLNSMPFMATFFKSDHDENIPKTDHQLQSCLFSEIFDESDCLNSVENQGILISVNDGQILSVALPNNILLLENERSLPITKCRPLLCIHQRIISAHSINLETNPTASHKCTQGLLISGVLGRLVVFFCNSAASDKRISIVELHVPSPIINFTVSGGVTFHVDGISLWSSKLIPHRDGLHVNTVKVVVNLVSAVHLLENTDDYGNTHILGVLLTTDGDFLKTKSVGNLDAEKEEQNEMTVAADVKDLLTDIHRSSELLLDIGRRHEAMQRVQLEIAWAAHLMLNDKVRESLKTTVTSDWSAAKPDLISINVSVLNSGDFNIDGSNWHIIITCTDAINRKITKSTPLLKGLVAGETIGSSLNLSCDQPVTDRFLPISVACSLKYEVPMLNVANTDCDKHEGEEPFTFRVLLNTTVVDVLYFLDSSEMNSVSLMPCHGVSLEEALWEMALRHRRNWGSSGSSSVIKAHGILQTAVGHVAFQRKHATKVLPQNILALLIVDSPLRKKCLIDETTTELKCSLFSENVQLRISEEGCDILKIQISVSHPMLLAPLRHGVIRKLLLFHGDDESSKMFSTISTSNSLISISRRCLANCKTLKSVLSHIMEEGKDNLLCGRLYHELRETVSSKLPFI